MPVEVAPDAGAGQRDPSGVAASAGTASIAVVIVTWNRKDDVNLVLGALSRQRYPVELLDVIIVDNASTDGTLEAIRERWAPDAVVHNATESAHEPAFGAPDADDRGNGAGFRSLTVVRNQANMGGCGGFNTGFAYAEQRLKEPDFLWLVDDDIDLEPDTLTNLVSAAATDDSIGLVGSRTCDIAHREKTIETTIFFHPHDGSMSDHPPSDHPTVAAHERWLTESGGTRGEGPYTGLRDVDIVSACCMLARWSGVKRVGFWDWRYFIYCDDADWSLRFGKAGYRVVCNLDAVVYHTPWNMKLTPARIYYAQRNGIWMLQKVLEGRTLRRATRTYLRRILRFSLHAALHRRLFHAEVIRRTALDVTTGRTGKTAPAGAEMMPVMEAFERCGVLDAGARVAVLGMMPDSAGLMADLQSHVREALDGDDSREPQWVPVMRNDVEDPPADSLIYGGRRRSRIKRQFSMLSRRPKAAVVFDQINDFPLVFGSWTIHIDQRDPTRASIERDGLFARLRFIGRWIPTVLRCMVYTLRVKPHRSDTKYG